MIFVDENQASGNEISNREWHYTINGDILLQIVEISTDITMASKLKDRRYQTIINRRLY